MYENHKVKKILLLFFAMAEHNFRAPGKVSGGSKNHA